MNRIQLFTPTIKERTAFQVGNRLYRTPQAAAKTISWSWIFNKYGGMKNTQSPSIEDVKQILDMECCCMEKAERGDYGEPLQLPFELCPIHDREVGYFRKLHERCVRAILMAWNYSNGRSVK